MTYIPERGDVIWLNFYPQVNHKSERRAVLILSPKAYNDASGLAIVCPIVTRIKGYPFEVSLPEGLGITGVILADHAHSVDWIIGGATFIGQATELVVAEVRGKISVLI